MLRVLVRPRDGCMDESISLAWVGLGKHWCRLLAAALILLAAGLHLGFLAFNCPLDLAPDEAHYWDWSRHLDWSYYSKGPLVAYLIRVSEELVGRWTNSGGISPAFAVRLPAVACGSLLLSSVYVLTAQVYRSERLALAATAAALTLPVIGAGSSLMTIDAPYACCWGWALVLAHRAILDGRAWWWAACGALVGLGLLAKFNMGLFIPSVALFLLFSHEHRRLLLRPGFWVMSGVAALGCVPILLWNMKYNWVTVRHVQGLAGMSEEAHWHWEGPFAYIGAQCGLYLVFWFLAWVAAMVAHRPWKEGNPGLRFLWWLSAPMFTVFLLFSFQTGGGEPNWPVTAYISGLVLAAGWLSRQLRAGPGWRRRWIWIGAGSACALGITTNVLMHRGDVIYPWLAQTARALDPDSPMPLRKVDPTCRLRGWRTLAGEVDRLRVELAASGQEPVIVGAGWALPGELAFYCAEHPTVHSIGPALGDRRSQYDLWHPNPIADQIVFAGQTFIVVGCDDARALQGAFEYVDPPRRVVHYDHGQPVAGWTVIVARGYRGFPTVQGPKRY
jgi:Dolichyl-phosphate-mannose-protein mannosyltransferase